MATSLGLAVVRLSGQAWKLQQLCVYNLRAVGLLHFQQLPSFTQHRNFGLAACLPCPKNSARVDEQSGKTVSLSKSNSDFQNVYTFRYIVHTRVLSRFKIYQTLLTVGAVPLGMYLYEGGVLSIYGVATFVGIASFATFMLYVMSTFFRRFVGIISFNQKDNLVRISHLTFWGHRRDLTVSLSEIVPLSDMSVKPDDIYQEIRFYDKPDKFYWFHRHGKSTDPALLQAMFGKI